MPKTVSLWLTFLVCLAYPATLRANVYATNIRLNGGITNQTIAPGTNVAISYILNEVATAGLRIDINSGASSVRTITLTNGAPGTARGTNTILWNGTDNLGQPVAGGSYFISITAAAVGSNSWWQTSDDFNTNNYVYEPRGITVNRNPNSPYYGRIFVSNSQEGPHPESNPGDALGMQKFNADATTPADGGFGDGGRVWEDGTYSPWKLEIGSDDRLYVSEFYDQGGVFSFDETISSNSLRQVLRSDNWPNPNVNLNGLLLTGSATNQQIWMVDDSASGLGIRRWNTTNGIVATNDHGATVISAVGSSDLGAYPYDLAIDSSNRIYVVQNTVVSGDPINRLLRFPSNLSSNADWKIGSGDNSLINAVAVSVNPAGNYVAVAVRGLADDGAVRVFSTTNGAPIASISSQTGMDATDVAWDNAGNLYAADRASSAWRIYSPPGSNQTTTIAIPSVIVTGSGGGGTAPILSQPFYTNGQYHFTLTGDPGATYVILGSTDLKTWIPVATNTSASAVRQITINAPANQSYYRAVPATAPSLQPLLTGPFFGGGQFQFTLVGDANATYVILASSNFTNWAPVLTNTSASASRPIAIPASGQRTFYRAMLQTLP